MAKTVIVLVFTLIVSASIPSPIFAAANPRSKPAPVSLGGLSLSATISGYLFAGSEQLEATPLYGLKIGYDKIATSIADSLGVEGSVNYFSTKSKVHAGDSSGYLFRLDAIYPFVVAERWMPFLAVGGGGIFIDTASRSESNFLFNYGAGLKYFMENYLAVRVDARHILVYDNVNTHNNFEVGIGLSYYFGKERKKKSEPKQEVKNDIKNGKKTDGAATKTASGIPALEEIESTAGKKAAGENNPAAKYDILNVPPSTSLLPFFALTPLLALELSAKVPYQPEAPTFGVGKKYMVSDVGPAKVEAAPPPAGEMPPMQVAIPVVVPGEPPPSAAIIPSSVITGGRKSEPDLTLPMAAGSTQPSPAKSEEPVPGAAEKDVVRKLSVKFDADSSFITPEFYNELVESADIMKSSDSISARIERHPDSIGDIMHNMMLSEKRSERVRNSLINLGVNPDRISTVVYEPSRPIADNAATEGNHVIFVTLTGEPKTVPAPAAAEKVSAPAKVEAAPLKSEPVPAPAVEKKPLQVTAPTVVPVPLVTIETVPSVSAEAMPAPAGEKAPAQVAAPGVATVPPSVATIPSPVTVEIVPSVRGEAMLEPAAAEVVSAPAKVETAPLKSGPTPAPAVEKAPAKVTAPVVVPAPPAPSAIVETVAPVSAEAVPTPAAAEEVPAPSKVETAPLETEPAPAQVTVPAVVPVPPSVATIPSPVTAGEGTPETAPALPVTSAQAQPAPANLEKPAHQAVGKKVVMKLAIEFDINSSYVKPKYHNKLSAISDLMKSSANASARIEGHADSTGRWSYNVKLSKLRAQSVMSSLIKLGVASGRISTAGYGPSRPIADNDTVEGRRRNRRAVTFVTLVIYE